MKVIVDYLIKCNKNIQESQMITFYSREQSLGFLLRKNTIELMTVYLYAIINIHTKCVDYKL